MSLTERFVDSRALLFGGTVAGSLASVLVLPEAHPIRVVAAVILFIIAPGFGLESALLSPRQPTAPWERVALIGALGLAASAAILVVLFAIGSPITAVSVGVATATMALGAWYISFIRMPSAPSRAQHAKTLKFALAIVVIVSGGVIGSATASTERPEYFTILALEDVGSARAAIAAGRVANAHATIQVIVESHEAEANEYQVMIVDGAQSPPFTLAPSERRIVEIDVAGAPAGSIEIRLMKSGQLDRTLRLAAS